MLRLNFAIQIYSGDVNNHIGWAKDALNNGFSGIYERSFEKYGVMTPTYPPIPLFFFTLFYWLFTVVYNLAWKLNLSLRIFPSKIIWFLQDQDTMPAFLKIPAILSDLGIAYFVYLFSKKILGKVKTNWPIILTGLVLFNPAFFYNSSHWGQIEAVPLFFILGSFYTLFFSRKSWLSVLFLVLAFLSKQTVIIFSPLFALAFYKKFGFKESFKGVLLFLFVFIIFFLPFFHTGNPLIFPFTTYWMKIQTGSGSNYVTDHAFNFWALISGLGKIPDWKPFWFGVSYSNWGYFIFILVLLLIFIPLFKNKAKPIEYVFAAGLIPFAAFLFLTRMHERYLEPSLPFLLLLATKRKSFLVPFLYVCFFHLVNLYHNWWAPGNVILKKIFSDLRVIQGLTVVVIGVFGFLLVKYLRGKPQINND